ncbi:Protein FLOURY 1-like [Linum grandiflorum]
MECAACLKFLARISESRGGFLVFGCFSKAFNFLWLFLLFAFGLKLLQFTPFWIGLVQFTARGKSIDSRNGFSSVKGFNLAVQSKVGPFESDFVNHFENEDPISNETESLGGDDDHDDDGFDVMALRRLVRIERKRAEAAELELEKERMAAASAADETMAMILRLQNEKSCAEIGASQYRRLAEQKQEYDQEVINSLQWIVTRHEYERSLLEEKLQIFRGKLQHCLNRYEMDELDSVLSSLDSSFEDFDLDDSGGDGLMMVGFESPAVQTKVFQSSE